MRAAARWLRARWRELAGTGLAASLSLGLLVALSAAVATAGARASVLVPTRALQHGLSRLAPEQKAVLGSATYTDVAAVAPVSGDVLAA